MSDNPDQPAQDTGLIDWSGALQQAGGDEELLAELTSIFFDEAQKNLSAIRTAIDEGNAVELHRTAHMLKSSLRIFQLTSISNVASQLEKTAKDNQLDQAPHLWEQLEPQVRLVIAELQRRSQS